MRRAQPAIVLSYSAGPRVADGRVLLESDQFPGHSTNALARHSIAHSGRVARAAGGARVGKARTARPESPPTAGMDGPGRMRKSLSLAARGRVFTAAAAATTRAPTASRAPQTGGGGLLARLPQSA